MISRFLVVNFSGVPWKTPPIAKGLSGSLSKPVSSAIKAVPGPDTWRSRSVPIRCGLSPRLPWRSTAVSAEPHRDAIKEEQVFGSLDAAADLERRHRDLHACKGREQRGVRSVCRDREVGTNEIGRGADPAVHRRHRSVEGGAQSVDLIARVVDVETGRQRQRLGRQIGQLGETGGQPTRLSEIGRRHARSGGRCRSDPSTGCTRAVDRDAVLVDLGDEAFERACAAVDSQVAGDGEGRRRQPVEPEVRSEGRQPWSVDRDVAHGTVQIRPADQAIDRDIDVAGRPRSAVESIASGLHPESAFDSRRHPRKAVHSEYGDAVRQIGVLAPELEIGADETLRCRKATVTVRLEAADRGRYSVEPETGIEDGETALDGPRFRGQILQADEVRNRVASGPSALIRRVVPVRPFAVLRNPSTRKLAPPRRALTPSRPMALLPFDEPSVDRKGLRGQLLTEEIFDVGHAGAFSMECEGRTGIVRRVAHLPVDSQAWYDRHALRQ